LLELQSALAGAVGDRFHAAMRFVARAVEHDFRDPRVLRPGSDALANLERLLRLLARLEIGAGHRRQRAARHVVDELRRDVLERAEDDETRTLRRSAHLLAYAQMSARALLFTRLCDSRHGYLPPALPALRRITSPA